MKLRVTLIGYSDDVNRNHRDVTLTVDVTATVGEVAYGMVRAGAGNPRLLPFATNRHIPMTLRVHLPEKAPLILDASDSIAVSGLQSGSVVEPVPESDPGGGTAVRSSAATLTVLDGAQKGVSFKLVQGENGIGRDRSNRVELHDPTISRKHALIRVVDGSIELEDLGSANGTSLFSADRTLQKIHRVAIAQRTHLEIGAVPVRIDPGPPPPPEPNLQSSVLHLQSPRVDPVYSPVSLELPAPPDPPEPSRFPIIAMFAPMIMGAVLYLTTRSMMSLIFVAVSPLIMIGTWVDNRFSRRKVYRAKKQEFEGSLKLARDELAENQVIEQAAREAETPPPAELLGLPATGASLLWTRRPEHRAFLELRLGKARLPSRKEVKLPARGKIPAEEWQRLSDLHGRYATVPDVPVLERLDRCGSLAVSGTAFWADQVMRSLLVQLFALHSPADLVFTAFADQRSASGEWAWLKWLPHVDSAYSTLGVAHLAADPRSSSILLTALEGLIAERTSAARRHSVRSRVTGTASDAKERLSPAEDTGARPRVVVLVLSDDLVDRTRLVGLAEDGADVGVHVLWIAPHMDAVPAACRTTIEVHEAEWRVHFVRQGETVALSSIDTVAQPLADTFARGLAPFVDAGARVIDETDFPRSVALGQIIPGDILGSGEAVLRRWEAADSLTARWNPGVERDAGALASIVGQGSAGPVEIDLRTHGPHALVGGTTGSGKSEFLQSWILSLAANYAPDRLTFLLVDYKGGAAFADCVGLPHTVGLVTDLNTHLVRRALTSLRAELRYREELLAEKGAKDLIALERRADPETPPALVIVIDEFAALVSEIPEFVDGVIDVAQRGRSLGLHLVMATQRPAGVIKDNLRANTNLRVGLRMADPADSTDVIGVKDAAEFAPDVPGRAVVKVGAGSLTHFQAGYLGGRSESDHREAVEINDLAFGEHAPWAMQPEARRSLERSRKGPRDIEVLADHIRAAYRAAGCRPPRKPWVDQLPEALSIDAPVLQHPRNSERERDRNIVVGLIDEPHLQRQSPYAIPFGEVGNALIVGGPGSGKTTALITVACAAIKNDPRTIIYGIDAGGGRLQVLDHLPGTGSIVQIDERDRIIRLLSLVKSITNERSAAQGDGEDLAPVLLLIDGFAAFRDTYEHLGGGTDPFADLVEVARAGRTVGVHIVFASERAAQLPGSLAASTSERLSLRLPSDSDYQSVGVPLGVLDNAPTGRALRIGSNDELQWATPAGATEPIDIDEAVLALAEMQGAQSGVSPQGVPELPTSISREEMPLTPRGEVPFAIDTIHLASVPAPSEGFLLVTGPAGSGRTTTIRSLLASFVQQSTLTGVPLDAVLISPRHSELRATNIWSAIADTADGREELIERLTLALGGTKPKPAGGLALIPLVGTAPTPLSETSAEPETEAKPFPKPGHRAVVVVEDLGGFDGSGDEQSLARLLKLLRRSDHTVIVEGENATIGAVWELAAPLRGARWAIALQPDANDSPSIFTTNFTHAKRADFPPGRGYLLRSGSITGVHIGLPEE